MFERATIANEGYRSVQRWAMVCRSQRALTLRLSTVAFAISLLFAGLPPTAFGQDYRIGEGDLLKITVKDNPDLTTVARVSSEGKIAFPMIGEIGASGLTLVEVQQQITANLQAKIIKNPVVTVVVEDYKLKKIIVLGEFAKPGMFELRGNATLMEVFFNAGGVTVNAGEELSIMRRVFKPGQELPENQTVVVPLRPFLEGRNSGEQVPVADGDIIYVARTEIPRVTTLGEFNKPGLIELRGSATLMDAISRSGGLSENAGGTVVIRRNILKPDADAPQEVAIVVTLAPYLEGRAVGEQILLKDGDSIQAPQAVFINVNLLGEFAKPGMQKLRQGATLLEAISSAGGVTANAGDDLVVQSRDAAAGQAVSAAITVPLTALLEGRNTTGKTTVADGDSIYIGQAPVVFVSGAVKTPGTHKITRGATVLNAIIAAGGFTARASKGKTTLTRKTDAGQTTAPAQMDTLLLPGDVVDVPTSFF